MTVDVAIVGAGFAGLAMAGALRRAGRESFVVLERGSSVGGTWRDNTYPGVACDVPSHLYGLAQHPWPDWSGTFARGDEIHRYLRHVADAEGLRERLLLDTPLLAARWTGSAWELTTGGPRRSTVRARRLVLACGRLTEPRIPEIPNLDAFTGPIFHSARWDHTVPLAGRRIAVVGTGASAVQLVPELVRRGAEVVLFQRTPAWIVPRGAVDYSAEERRRLAAHPDELAALRAQLYLEGEQRFASRSGDADAAAAAEHDARAHLAAQVDDVALRAALTPDYAFGCKRVLLSDDFYPAVASDAVTFEASALDRVEGGALVAASGERHHADALVLATGFAASEQPYAHLVMGEDGVTLAEHWAGGMTSFASTVVSGFPNLFVLNGPNASLGHNSSVLMAEAQAGYVVGVLARADAAPSGSRSTQAPEAPALRVDPDAERRYTQRIDAAAASTPWIRGGCANWYVDERSGRLTLLWPGTVDAFRAMLDESDGSEFLPAGTPRDPSRARGES
ncbi:NAD(P)/FAD-dependent oxidoreductase [Microbacterium sp. cx-55]|uniref:flavin-containing monooxygenase n=1 Tax=Microbacterium sp. cx-55 TaxID=2875948 RepID=UPI001CBE6F43|nr:NAD(P)/FAD-dependent oxidoreductase [Microbacterium sp. cx-55]UGB34935.1 NAD(P)/FAD-dependent oxidoreductase [Microbacterium sp. cx-55]